MPLKNWIGGETRFIAQHSTAQHPQLTRNHELKARSNPARDFNPGNNPTKESAP